MSGNGDGPARFELGRTPLDWSAGEPQALAKATAETPQLAMTLQVHWPRGSILFRTMGGTVVAPR